MLKKAQPDLIFEPGALSGFGVLAEQSELNPITITRELIQNSLDAAREAGRTQAIIRFEVAEHAPKDIPAFPRYKKAFKAAVKGFAKKHGGKLPDSAQSVVEGIEKQIAATRIETLFVMDNGIGLNEGRMAALLAEGISDKSHGGAGSYGYGHTAIIPASDLRYILYGGLHAGKKIAAGHAVLASFEEDKEIKGKDGYFIIEKTAKLDNPFNYPSGDLIPDITKSKLDFIESEWQGSGSVIAITGFNFFRERKEKLWDLIEKAAACNFFVAIAEGHLRIEFVEKTGQQVLDDKSIARALEKHAEEKRARHFLNGNKANKSYASLQSGELHEVKTDLGNIAIKLNPLATGERSQIDLCRNGMHISSAVPYLKQSDFADYAPFHALILVEMEHDAFHRLIRKSEPPKHNAIEMKKLESKERAQLKASLIQIKDYIKGQLEKLAVDEFRVADVLNIRSFGVNTVEELPPRPRAAGKSGGGGGGNGKGGSGGGGGNDGGFRKQGTTIPFQAIPVQTSKRSYDVQINLEKSKYDNEIRFALDESIDLTCDKLGAEDFVALSNIKLNGEKVDDKKLVKEDGKILGINLGSSTEERKMRLTFDFSILDSNIGNDVAVSLQAELVQRKAEKMADDS